MGRAWLSIRVELVAADGQPVWQPPGRVFAVRRRHTYGELAEAIDDAFSRWNEGSVHEFRFRDGRRVGIPEWGGPLQHTTDSDGAQETGGSRRGATRFLGGLADDRFTRVSDLRLRDRFTYRSRPFLHKRGLWIHRCTVGERRIDPFEALGLEPSTPLAYAGWGELPQRGLFPRQPSPALVAATARRVPDLPAVLWVRPAAQTA